MDSSTLKIAGRLRIYIDGQLVGDHRNLVVDDGLEAIWKAFGGDATMVVGYFEAGDGTTPPANGDTDTENATFGPKAVTSITYPSAGAIKVTFDIIPGEATGEDFTEFTIKTVGLQLTARVVDGNTYSKTALNTIQGIWDITLTR